jgi:hypothetical protein
LVGFRDWEFSRADAATLIAMNFLRGIEAYDAAAA